MMVYIFQTDVLSPKLSRNPFGKGSFLGEMRHLLSASSTAGQLAGSKLKHFMEKSSLYCLGRFPKETSYYTINFMFIIKGPPKLPTLGGWGALMVY